MKGREKTELLVTNDMPFNAVGHILCTERLIHYNFKVTFHYYKSKLQSNVKYSKDHPEVSEPIKKMC